MVTVGALPSAGDTVTVSMVHRSSPVPELLMERDTEPPAALLLADALALPLLLLLLLALWVRLRRPLLEVASTEANADPSSEVEE